MSLIDDEAATAAQSDADSLIRAVEQLGTRMERVRQAVGQVIFGQSEVVEQSLVTLLAGGHMLLIGVPGLAKTRLVETLGKIIGMEERRIQCTPDLMPADILGSEVLEESPEGRRGFRFIKGPVFSQLLMADEINRASPRTQSALLQAMQEYSVTVAGETRHLAQPFFVLATQNPIEQEGTYPLPEAQLDRFLLQIDVDYPDIDAERRILLETTGVGEAPIEQVMTADELLAAQRLVRRVPVGESVVEAILTLVRSARPGGGIPLIDAHAHWGPGPRASQSLMLATRARAVMHGRLAPSIDDVIALAAPVLRHRMALNFAARHEGITLSQVIDTLTSPLH